MIAIYYEFWQGIFKNIININAERRIGFHRGFCDSIQKKKIFKRINVLNIL